jgi:hypothetical protein
MPLSSDILIVPAPDKDPFNGTTTMTMLILKSPASLINSTMKFCVEWHPGNQNSALYINPVAVGNDHDGQGALLLSASVLDGPCKFSVLFDDGCILTKELEGDSDSSSYLWELTENDCEAFLLKKIRIIRAETNSKRFDYSFEDQAGYLQGLADIFPVLVERFLEEAAEHVNWVPVRAETTSIDNSSQMQSTPEASFEESADYCYVYLMNDTTTGYYKIGMSNNPEYRESTLQSEKPTIVKVCHKKYPSRRVARGIEAALHRIFDGKRIRGEWFRLNERDIWEIKQTLL